jgi:RHS repeat-associated protein
MLYELTNQLTYRGYFYDFETGLYYLQSRYYAPNWGRFINADKHFDTGDGILGTNMYIYCLDNPIKYTDPNGEGILNPTCLLVKASSGTTSNGMLVMKNGGKSITLTAAAEPTNIQASSYKWTTSNAAIVDIGGKKGATTGKVVTLKPKSAGDAVVKVSIKGISSELSISYHVYVLNKIEVQASNTPITAKTIYVGQSFTVKPTPTPNDGVGLISGIGYSEQIVSVTGIKKSLSKTIKGLKAGTTDVEFHTGNSELVAKVQVTVKNYVTKQNLIDFGWSNVTDKKVIDLNRALGKFGITSKENIRHFLGQCASESAFGVYTTEIADGWAYDKSQNAAKASELGNTQVGDGPKFKGGGYIQITGRTIYQKLADATGDQEIVKQGVSYVAANYAWDAAGYFWSEFKKYSDGKYIRDSINSTGSTSIGGINITATTTVRDPKKGSSGSDVVIYTRVAKVTRLVNGGYNHAYNRNEAYKKIKGLLP